ncbi:hypothetical protein JCM16358_13410 [Halanaerocella petrolearia]
MKSTLFLLITALSILILLLTNNSLPTYYSSERSKSEIDYQELNQQIENYLKKKSNNTNQAQTITNKENLNKLRSALFLYLQDNYHLPTDINQLVGDYLKSIPQEKMSHSNKISNQLDYTGGWYYNPQSSLNQNLKSLISTSLKPNIKRNHPTDFEPYKLIVNTTQDKLYLTKGNKRIRTYPIAHGSKNKPTPTGEFTVKRKVILNDKQKKVYGEYWIGLDIWTKGGSYGLHATTTKKKLAQQSSRGCIRLQPEDIAELYQLIPLQTKTIIK